MKTFAMIKPDIAKGFIGGIIQDIEDYFDIVELRKEDRLNDDQAETLYAEHLNQPFYDQLMGFTLSGPVVLMVLANHGVCGGGPETTIEDWRGYMGASDPAKAIMGTIRRRWGRGMPDNAVHGSADAKAALRELELFFPDTAATERRELEQK